jgi:hypothetical protein
VKVYLLEKKQDYIKCLQLYLSGIKVGTEVMTSKEAQDKTFKWIREKLHLLEGRASDSVAERHVFETFKREVTQSVKILVQFNPLATFHLIEEKYNGNHQEIIDSLNRDQ